MKSNPVVPTVGVVSKAGKFVILIPVSVEVVAPFKSLSISSPVSTEGEVCS